MLSLDRPITIDGIAVFRDHADPNQFWSLPGPVALARRPPGDRAAFSFIQYKPAVAGAGVPGGGFAMFETTLELSPGAESRIRSRLLTEPGVTNPRVSVVMFEEGTVQCIALNLQGSGGAVAVSPPPGAFNAVQQILGAATPSLDGENRAAFSLTLSQEGSIILRQAFEDGLAPIGVLYSFVYSGMRPALEVEITADLEMIFNHFSASLEAQYQFVRAGIDAAFESLKQTGAIKIKVLNFTGEADEKEQEDWALTFFKEDLLSKWFEPTFTPGQLAAAAADADPLETVAKFAREALQGQKPEAGKDEKPKEDSKPKEEGKKEEEKKDEKKEEKKTEDTRTIVQPAVLTPTSQTPLPLPAGRSVTHVAAASGTQETITVSGEGAVVRVAGQPRTLDSAGRFTVEVAPEQTLQLEVDWPAAAVDQTFHLFFDFDKPAKEGWSTSPPSTQYRAYVENTTGDARYKDASGVENAGAVTPWPGGEKGGAALSAWLATLAAPRTVEVDAHASFETQAQPGSGNRPLTGGEQSDHNMRLSMRRADVAVALVARAGVALSTPARSHGDSEARGDAANPATGQPEDRVVKLKGRVAAGQPASFRGQLHRPKSKVEKVEPPKPGEPPKKEEPPKTGGQTTSSSVPAAVSLKLKFIRQEERKKMTFHYNRAEAVRRIYAPQGFFGLMLAELDDKESYFSEADLDALFFREITITAEAPIDFARIGLASAQVAIDYGDPANAANHKHSDFVFRSDDRGPKEFTVFMNADHDLEYTHVQQFHFSPDADWDGDGFTVERPAERTADRTLFVNPAEVLDFLEITVRPGDIDVGVVDSTEVTLEATGPGGFNKRKTFVVLADSAPQIWRLRAPKPVPPETRVITFTLTHHLKDGTVQTIPPAVLDSSTLIVHDPFPQSLNIEFVPLFDAAAVRQVFIDVAYEDAANNYARRERLDVPGARTENVKLRLALLDPAQRQFRFRFTVVGANGDFRRLAEQTSDEEIVPIQV